jgi:hypothetical protein
VNPFFRLGFALIVMAARGIWAINAFDAYWGHLASFSTWAPKWGAIVRRFP